MNVKSATAEPVSLLPMGGSQGFLDRLWASVGSMMPRLSGTILLAVGIATGCGLAVLWGIYSAEQTATLTEQDRRTMQKLSESVVRGLEAVMLQGSVDSVDNYVDRLKTVNGIADLLVLRADGKEAFRDNKTVTAVNERLGGAVFRPHERRAAVVPNVPAEELSRSIRENRPVTYYGTGREGERVMTQLYPLRNDKECQHCHGADHDIRGVLQVTTSIAAMDQAIKVTQHKTLAVLAGALLAILVITYILLRLIVVRRLERISVAMNGIVVANYSMRVPDVGRDELGQMGRCFNHMAETLSETTAQLTEKQNMMTAVLRGAHDGVVVANPSGNIVMVNAAAEHLLGKSSRQIYKGGLKNIFDDPARVEAWKKSPGDVAEEITYDGKPLQLYVSHIQAPNKVDLGMAIMMRDIAGERQLREELRKLHFLDQQTGLGNARLFDQTLARSLDKAGSAGGAIGVLVVNVDSIKEATLHQGPAVAEQMLKQAIRVLGDVLGRATPVYRIGDDSLGVLIQGALVEHIEGIAERALEAMEASPGEGFQLWASAGVAMTSPHTRVDKADLLGAARHALADAIEAGGGCVRVATGVQS